MKVFDNTGKYLSRIGDSTGDGKMDYPHSLAIYENRILISQGYYSTTGPCILNYQLDGKFISRIGRNGSADLEFRYPFGLTIDQTNADIYVCDSDNKRYFDIPILTLFTIYYNLCQFLILNFSLLFTLSL